MSTSHEQPAIIDAATGRGLVPDAITRAAACLDDHDPITALYWALLMAEDLDTVRRHAVTAARAEGRTWQEIGEALGGITRQAAQQRYGN